MCVCDCVFARSRETKCQAAETVLTTARAGSDEEMRARDAEIHALATQVTALKCAFLLCPVLNCALSSLRLCLGVSLLVPLLLKCVRCTYRRIVFTTGAFEISLFSRECVSYFIFFVKTLFVRVFFSGFGVGINIAHLKSV